MCISYAFLSATVSDKFRLNSIRFHKKKSLSATEPEKITTKTAISDKTKTATCFDEINMKSPMKSPMENFNSPLNVKLNSKTRQNTLIVPGNDNDCQHPSPFYTRNFSVLNLSGKSFHYKNDMINSTVHLAVCTEVADRESLKNCDIILPRSTSQYSQDFDKNSIPQSQSKCIPESLNSIPGAFIVQTDIKLNIINIKQPSDFMSVHQAHPAHSTGNLYSFVDPRSLSQFKKFHNSLIRTSKSKTAFPLLFKTPLNTRLNNKLNSTMYSITGFVVKIEDNKNHKPEKSDKPIKLPEKLQKSRITSVVTNDSSFYLVFSENTSGSVSVNNSAPIASKVSKLNAQKMTQKIPKLKTSQEISKQQKQDIQSQPPQPQQPLNQPDLNSFIPPTPQVTNEAIAHPTRTTIPNLDKNISNEAVIATSSKTDSGSGIKREAVYQVMPLENSQNTKQNTSQDFMHNSNENQMNQPVKQEFIFNSTPIQQQNHFQIPDPRLDLYSMTKRSRPSIEEVVNSNLFNNNFKTFYTGYSQMPPSIIIQQQLAIQIAKAQNNNNKINNPFLHQPQTLGNNNSNFHNSANHQTPSIQNSYQGNHNYCNTNNNNANLRPTIPSPASTTTINILSATNSTVPILNYPIPNNDHIIPPSTPHAPNTNTNFDHNYEISNRNLQTVSTSNKNYNNNINNSNNIPKHTTTATVQYQNSNISTSPLPDEAAAYHHPNRQQQTTNNNTSSNQNFYNNLSLQISKLDSLNPTPTRVITIDAQGQQRQHTPSGTDETDDCRPVTEPPPQEKIQWKSSNSETGENISKNKQIDHHQNSSQIVDDTNHFHQGTARVNCGFGFEALTPESAMCEGPEAKCIVVPKVDPSAPIELPTKHDKPGLSGLNDYVRMPIRVMEKLRAYRESKKTSSAQYNSYLNNVENNTSTIPSGE